MNIHVRVVKLAGLHLAITQLGGMTIRGGSRPDPVSAVQSLFQVLGGVSGNTDDALLAVSLGMQGTTLEEAAQLESKGSDAS